MRNIFVIIAALLFVSCTLQVTKENVDWYKQGYFEGFEAGYHACADSALHIPTIPKGIR